MLIWATIAVATAAQIELSPGDDLITRTESLQPGDEVIFNDGFYRIQGALNWSVASTEDFPTIVRAADGASPVIELVANESGDYADSILRITDSNWMIVEGVTFQGDAGWTDSADNHNGVRISNSSNITLRDMEVAQTGRTAITIGGDSNGVTIERVHIHDTLDGFGIYAGCSDGSCFTVGATVRNNWIHGIGGENTYGMFFAHGTQGANIVDNVVYGVQNRGAYVGSTEFGDPNIFEGNAIWNVTSIGLFLEGAALVRNNIIFNVDGTGIYSRDPERNTFSDQILSFNTVANTTDWAARLEDWYYASGMVLANNALCNPVGYGIDYDLPPDLADDTAIPPTNNLLSTNIACGLVEGMDRLDLDTAIVPGSGLNDFVDVESWDFYPASRDSSLVNSANPAGEAYVPELDFSGYPREGDAPDVGAYEYFQDGNPGWLIAEGFKQFPELELDDGRLSATGGCCDDNTAANSAAWAVPLVGMGAFFRRRRHRQRCPQVSATG